MKGIEPSYLGWEPRALPLSYTRGTFRRTAGWKNSLVADVLKVANIPNCNHVCRHVVQSANMLAKWQACQHVCKQADLHLSQLAGWFADKLADRLENKPACQLAC